MASRVIQGFFPHGARPKAGGALDPGRLGLGHGPARALPEPLRREMEQTFRADFSAVRVRVGPQADRIGALAFACGDDLYFAPGGYAPDTAAGRRLIGHELAHVVQQRAGRVRAPAGALAVVQDPGLEAEADRMASLAAAQAARARPAAPSIQRMSAPAVPQPPAARTTPASSPSQRRHAPPPTTLARAAAAQRFARPAGAVLQPRLKKHEARRELGRLLTNSGIDLDSRARGPLDLAADAVGDLEDTTTENMTLRLLRDPTIEPVFRSHRLDLDESPWPRLPVALTASEARLLAILKDMTFFAGTKSGFLGDIRMKGLSPSEGGKSGGGSDTQSVASKRDVHVKESKGKVYVTRDYKEASGYAESGTVPMMVFVPPDRQGDLQVDPHSRKGFYSERPLPMVDQDAGVFGAGVIGAIRDEHRRRHPGELTPETKDIRADYLSLIRKGALPRRSERLDQLAALRRQWDPILERLTDPSKGPINGQAAAIIEELNASDDIEQLRLLARLRLGYDKSGRELIFGYLRGG